MGGNHGLYGVEIVVDVVALCGRDDVGLGLVVDVVHILPVVVCGCGPRRGVAASELVCLDDIAAGDVRESVVGAVHRYDVHALGVDLDFFGEEVEPTVVVVDDDLAVLGAGGVMP